jgi:hypothetical protein
LKNPREVVARRKGLKLATPEAEKAPPVEVAAEVKETEE